MIGNRSPTARRSALGARYVLTTGSGHNEEVVCMVKGVNYDKNWLNLIERVYLDHLDKDGGKHETGVYLLKTLTGENWILMPRWHVDSKHARGGHWLKGLYCVDAEFEEEEPNEI